MKTTDQGVTAPLIPLVGDAKTMTSSELLVPPSGEPTWSISEVKVPPHPLLRPEWGGGGLWSFQMTGA